MNDTHNLDINMYKLDDLLGLFNLSYDISIEDLKRAKKIVMKTHPDKSRLDPKYFLFYKKAFDIIVQFYDNQNKQNKTTTEIDTDYDANVHNTFNKSSVKKVSSVIEEMDTNDFQNKFNKLFDENMTNKIDEKRNNWFTDQNTIYNNDEKVNPKNMGDAFNRIKDTQNTMIQYKGVENLYVNSGSGNKFHDEEDDGYVSTDPFSKLKFDDLRKVHKDQTVFSVSEKDYNNVKKYSSVDHFMRERGKESLTPLEKQEAEQLLMQQDKTYREQMMQKEYNSKMKSMQYAEKNKNVISSFLHITNK